MQLEDKQFRLQLLKHSGIFNTREEAIEYINDYLKPEVLLAEPAVVWYGNARTRNAILVIGCGDRKIFLIDTAKITEDIAAISETAVQNKDEVDYVANLVKDIIAASGLVLDENKKENQVSYNADSKDNIIGSAESLDQAIKLLSAYVQEHVTSNTIVAKDTPSVGLKYITDELGNKELSAEVKISTEGDDDEALFNDNIIGVKPDGIFAAVNLAFDPEKRKLIFSTSGIKNGKFVTDAKRKVLDLGEHTALVNGNTDSNPVKVAISEKDGKTVVAAEVKLSEDRDNIIKVKDGALMAEGRARNIVYKNSTVANAIEGLEETVKIFDKISIAVDAVTNTLTLSVGDKIETITLPGVDIIKNVKYNKSLHQLEITFQNGNTTIVPLDDLFAEYHFISSPTIELHEHANEDGSVTVVGDVVVSSREDNVLRQDESGLYVLSSEVGVSMRDVNDAVKVETERAMEAENQLRNDLASETNEHQNEIKRIEDVVIPAVRQAAVDKVNDETRRAESVEQELRGAIEAEANTRATEITRVEKVIDDKVHEETGRATTAENQLRTDLNAEIAERRADVKRVETEAIPEARQLALDKVAEEADRAKEAERGNAAAIAAEEARAKNREIELTAQLAAVTNTADTAAAKVETVKADLQSEIDRAKAVEEELKLSAQSSSEAISKEIADRKAANAVHDTQIKANTDRLMLLDGTKDQVGSIRNIINEANATVNSSIEKEKQRAKAAEEALGVRIDGLVTSNGDTLIDAKAYTDQQIAAATVKIDENAEGVAANKAKIESINTTLAGKVDNVELKPVDGQDLTYQLLADGKPAGTINIPRDNFFKDAEFDAVNNVLILTFSVPDSDTDKSVRIDMNSLVQIYKAGQGLDLGDGNTFFIRRNEAGDEGYLVVDGNGICVKGINAQLGLKANADEVYSKTESDNEAAKIRGEFADADKTIRNEIKDLHVKTDADIKTANDAISTEITRATGKESDLDTKIESNRVTAENGLNELKTTVAGIQSIVSNNTDAINTEVARATEVENRIESLVNAAEAKIATLNGGVGTPGSVADSVNNVKVGLEGKVAAEASRARKEETDIRTLIAANKTDAEAKIVDSVANAKTYVDNQLNTLEPRVTAVENEVKTKVSDVQLVHAADSLSYTLMVDGKEIGTINTNEVGGLEDVLYENGILTLVFLINGETKTVQVNLGEELTDIYEQGNGIKIENHVIDVIKDGASEDYLTVTRSGVGIKGIDAIKTIAENAQSTANTAKETADSVKTGIGEAKTMATEAKTMATEAKTMATEAKTMAIEAKAAADAALPNGATVTAELNTLKETVKTQGETIASLLERIEKLEKELIERTDFGVYTVEKSTEEPTEPIEPE